MPALRRLRVVLLRQPPRPGPHQPVLARGQPQSRLIRSSEHHPRATLSPPEQSAPNEPETPAGRSQVGHLGQSPSVAVFAESDAMRGPPANPPPWQFPQPGDRRSSLHGPFAVSSAWGPARHRPLVRVEIAQFPAAPSVAPKPRQPSPPLSSSPLAPNASANRYKAPAQSRYQTSIVPRDKRGNPRRAYRSRTQVPVPHSGGKQVGANEAVPFRTARRRPALRAAVPSSNAHRQHNGAAIPSRATLGRRQVRAFGSDPVFLLAVPSLHDS